MTAEHVADLAVKLLEADERTYASASDGFPVGKSDEARAAEWARANAWARAVVEFNDVKEELLVAARQYRKERKS